jgi:superfamily II DNA or RNA helicase
MAKLEELIKGKQLRGILPGQAVTIVAVEFCGSDALTLTYKSLDGKLNEQLLYRDRESELEIVSDTCPWDFKGDGSMLLLASEAYRIRLAHLFDPILAVHTSLVEPLPHQITAVYDEMLKRQPLRFLLADDPGAGKTIMAGLLMRELSMRGDLQRCLVVCPGSLAAQWQDELSSKFQLPFEILTNDRIEAARTGNALAEMPFVIARLDKLSRDEDLQAKLEQTDWDLVVCDEAHKMSASFFGGEVKPTKRHKLGKLLSKVTRHFLLMSATPHNGKEEDFQLFMGLLDSDRFEGKFRDGVHAVDTSDLMRRMIKEDLLKFDGTPLFPERKAYTVSYSLSPLEDRLYREVTEYVQNEFDRADKLASGGRKGTVGFALTILQRRLASSPEAIYQSLHRRRERLEARLQDERQRPNGSFGEDLSGQAAFLMDDDFDEDDLSIEEQEATEEAVVDQATAAQTTAELQIEIQKLRELEALALNVKRSGRDRKWQELSQLLQEILDFAAAPKDCDPTISSRSNPALPKSRKLVLFTEHRDTLNYLAERIGTLFGNPDAVVAIHGGLGRDTRKKAEEMFKQDPMVQVLLATDAAGEGINLQRAHLMVNYDLPWNPNRLEQRFGRIHRIGQTEVCHLWNLVAGETREGQVYLTLLNKLDQEQKALQGKVFDVLGKAIAGRELRDLLIEAIRYGDRPEVRAKLTQKVEASLDQQRLRDLLDDEVLAHGVMDASKVQEIREEMEKLMARRLQPYFIKAFFLQALQVLGGTVRPREAGRYEITHVPAEIRSRSSKLGRRDPILTRYERICFEKDKINLDGKPSATFVCPGQALLDAVLDLALEKHRLLLTQGAVLVDEQDSGHEVRALVYLEHSIQDARLDHVGNRRYVSRRMQFVEILADGQVQNAGAAPYLDYRSLQADEILLREQILAQTQLGQNLERLAREYAINNLVPQHLEELRQQKEALLDKTMKAVQERLSKEIHFWDGRADDLRQQEAQGKVNAKINSVRAQQRRDELEVRLKQRLEELQQERLLSPAAPLVVGGALVVPIWLIHQLQGKAVSVASLFARETKRVELAAMNAVMARERSLGYEPVDVSREKCGYDVLSRYPGDDRSELRFIEVKGRIEGADTVTVTKNEVITALNSPESYILVMVSVPAVESGAEGNCHIRYVRQPFQREPDQGAVSVNYTWQELWERGTQP